MKAIFSSLAFLVTCASVALALDCFTCNSKEDSACGDHFNYNSPALRKAFLKPCIHHGSKMENSSQPFCRKLVMNLELYAHVRVQRDCGFQRREGYDCYQKRSEDYVMDVCQCDGTECNAATLPLLSMLPTWMAVTLPFMARFL